MNGLAEDTINCPKCKYRLTGIDFLKDYRGEIKCPNCKLSMIVRTFAGVSEETDNYGKADIILSENESSCFFHFDKVAVSHCSECGRFLCALCAIEIEDRVLCPVCLERLDNEKRIKTFNNHVVFWDSIVLYLTILPVLIWPFLIITIISAPLSLVLINKHYKCLKDYVIPRKKWRFYLAGFIALLQIGGWCFFIFRIFFL